MAPWLFFWNIICNTPTELWLQPLVPPPRAALQLLLLVLQRTRRCPWSPGHLPLFHTVPAFKEGATVESMLPRNCISTRMGWLSRSRKLVSISLQTSLELLLDRKGAMLYWRASMDHLRC